KLAACGARGAEALVDYGQPGLKERIKEITGGGAHVVIDPVGGPYSEEALRATREGGRFVTVGYASGEITRIPLNLVLLKDVRVLGYNGRTFGVNHPELATRDHQELERIFASGRIEPLVCAVYGIDDVAAALHHVCDRNAIGKVILHPW